MDISFIWALTTIIEGALCVLLYALNQLGIMPAAVVDWSCIIVATVTVAKGVNLPMILYHEEHSQEEA